MTCICKTTPLKLHYFNKIHLLYFLVVTLINRSNKNVYPYKKIGKNIKCFIKKG